MVSVLDTDTHPQLEITRNNNNLMLERCSMVGRERRTGRSYMGSLGVRWCGDSNRWV